MYRQKVRKGLVAFFVILLLVVPFFVFANGTETLGTPDITIQPGSAVVAAGTGMVIQPGTININVPGPVKQALLYWEGQSQVPYNTDDTILVNGVSVSGTLIGGPTEYTTENWRIWSYRADITSLGLVSEGQNELSVQGMDFNLSNDGVGLLVIVDDGVSAADIQLRDGSDFAFINFSPPLDATVPQTFNFDPVDEEREGEVSLFVASVADEDYARRPNVIEIAVDGEVTIYKDLLSSNDGDFWDTVTIPITIPANASTVTVEVISRDDSNSADLPASLIWVAASFSVPRLPETPLAPKINLSKQISIDGGQTWAEADNPGEIEDDTPVATLPFCDAPEINASYRLVVKNDGQVDLKDVSVSDPKLGITGYELGNLAVDEERVVDSSEIPALEVANICTSDGTVNNVAEAVGQSTTDDSPAGSVSATNPANLVCKIEACVLPENPVLYTNDFEQPLGPEWSMPLGGSVPVTTTPKTQSKFLGEFHNTTVRFTHNEPVCPSALLRVSFDLYIIRSWDGNVGSNPFDNKSVGPDIFTLSQVGGPTYLRTTFTNWPDYFGSQFRQAFPGWFFDNEKHSDYPAQIQAVAVNELGFKYRIVPSGELIDQDAVYRIVALVQAPVEKCQPIMLEFSAEGLQFEDPRDESWGLDNFELRVEKATDYMFLPLVPNRAFYAP